MTKFNVTLILDHRCFSKVIHGEDDNFKMYAFNNAGCSYVVIMLSVVMLSVVMLSVVMLSVVMLSVVMLSVVMLCNYAECSYAV